MLESKLCYRIKVPASRPLSRVLPSHGALSIEPSQSHTSRNAILKREGILWFRAGDQMLTDQDMMQEIVYFVYLHELTMYRVT